MESLLHINWETEQQWVTFCKSVGYRCKVCVWMMWLSLWSTTFHKVDILHVFLTALFFPSSLWFWMAACLFQCCIDSHQEQQFNLWWCCTPHEPLSLSVNQRHGVMQSKWRQDSRARLDTCEKLENCFRQVFGDTACEAVGVQQQLEQLERVSGGVMESENFWKELYVRIYRPLFFARASVDGDFGELSQGVFVVQLTRDQPPWKQPWWNASRYLDPAEVDERRRLLGVRFKYILLGPDLDQDIQDPERDFALRERYRQALTHFGLWNLANNWTQAFMVLHHDLFPWTVHLIIDVTYQRQNCPRLVLPASGWDTFHDPGDDWTTEGWVGCISCQHIWVYLRPWTRRRHGFDCDKARLGSHQRLEEEASWRQISWRFWSEDVHDEFAAKSAEVCKEGVLPRKRSLRGDK